MAIRRTLRRWVAPFRSMHRLVENYFSTEELENLHALNNKRILPQDAQKVRPARPQRVKGRGVPRGYVEGLNDARTPHGKRRVSDFGELSRAARRGWAGEKSDFFSILLFRYEDQHPRRALFGHIREPSCGTAGGKSREDSSTTNLNGAEAIEGSLRGVEGEDPRDLSS